MQQKNTVSLWVNRFVNEGSLESHPKSGRPRITTPQVDQAIYQYVENQPFTTSTDVARIFDLSAITVRRRLNEHGLFHFIPAQQTKLTEDHKRLRVQFCEENLDRDWEKVIFSDEKTFKSSVDTKEHLWRPKNERFNPKYVQSVRKSGRISCGVWGFVTASGVGQLCEISPRMNSLEYTSILEDQLLPSWEIMFREDFDDMLFMQDNSGVHTSALTRNWFRSHPEVTILQWPARSPDLNPMENIWAKLVYKWQMNTPVNRNNVLQEVNRRWELLIGDTEYISALYGSMANRLREVIEYDGNWCSY